MGCGGSTAAATKAFVEDDPSTGKRDLEHLPVTPSLLSLKLLSDLCGLSPQQRTASSSSSAVPVWLFNADFLLNWWKGESASGTRGESVETLARQTFKKLPDSRTKLPESCGGVPALLLDKEGKDSLLLHGQTNTLIVAGDVPPSVSNEDSLTALLIFLEREGAKTPTGTRNMAVYFKPLSLLHPPQEGSLSPVMKEGHSAHDLLLSHSETHTVIFSSSPLPTQIFETPAKTPEKAEEMRRQRMALEDSLSPSERLQLQIAAHKETVTVVSVNAQDRGQSTILPAMPIPSEMTEALVRSGGSELVTRAQNHAERVGPSLLSVGFPPPQRGGGSFNSEDAQTVLATLREIEKRLKKDPSSRPLRVTAIRLGSPLLDDSGLQKFLSSKQEPPPPLQLSCTSAVKHFSLQTASVSPSGLSYLLEAISSAPCAKTFQTLDLSNCPSLGDSGVKALLAFVERCAGQRKEKAGVGSEGGSELREVRLRGSAVSEALQRQVDEKLFMHHNLPVLLQELSDTAEGRGTSVKCINLNHRGCGDEAAAVLSRFLDRLSSQGQKRILSSVTVLSLQGSSLSQRGLSAVLEGLKGQPAVNLEKIDVRDCRLLTDSCEISLIHWLEETIENGGDIECILFDGSSVSKECQKRVHGVLHGARTASALTKKMGIHSSGGPPGCPRTAALDFSGSTDVGDEAIERLVNALVGPTPSRHSNGTVEFGASVETQKNDPRGSSKGLLQSPRKKRPLVLTAIDLSGTKVGDGGVSALARVLTNGTAPLETLLELEEEENAGEKSPCRKDKQNLTPMLDLGHEDRLKMTSNEFIVFPARGGHGGGHHSVVSQSTTATSRWFSNKNASSTRNTTPYPEGDNTGGLKVIRLCNTQVTHRGLTELSVAVSAAANKESTIGGLEEFDLSGCEGITDEAEMPIATILNAAAEAAGPEGARLRVVRLEGTQMSDAVRERILERVACQQAKAALYESLGPIEADVNDLLGGLLIKCETNGRADLLFVDF
uniref:Uncharacterized protein n=1 Tax=Chromera velia CCMP2878 TaxID=1169474 RepID=A0A0K6S665_9ALVE|eukprot:Cvel_14852.t2-p1 / transcript=Cvel_14852.t2 / gene=Cvel_14852 / organism=Chromera_velia_CCMP2878 / gene_product=hypothetical protein / transcript_product=hypothetical protein / location=Cvel_scaffold1073:21731-28275(-) / protein_length=1000 / sequence_SO=supercontig / SO=protein_coding / is_pseudo=false